MLTSEEFFQHVIDRDDDRPGPLTIWSRWWSEEAAKAPELAAKAFVLTSREVADRGLSRSAHRTALRRGQWVPAGRGFTSPVDVTRELPENGAGHVMARRAHALRSAAASRARGSDVVAGRSAAILHGLPTLFVPPNPELLTCDAGGGLRNAHHVYTAALAADETCAWFGRALTSVPRTLVELARHDRFDAIMAVDAALREGVVDAERITRALRVARGWPGVKEARRVLALGDARSESPLESLTRLRIREAGLPVPEPQVWIGPWRVDFYWVKFGVVLEADGRVKYTGDQKWDEKKRDQGLKRLGVRRVERVTMHDVLGGWPATFEELHSILR